MAITLLITASNGLAASQDKAKAKSPIFSYWHNWTDRNGVSHMAKCEMDGMDHFVLQSMSKPADPQWQASIVRGSSGYCDGAAGWMEGLVASGSQGAMDHPASRNTFQDAVGMPSHAG